MKPTLFDLAQQVRTAVEQIDPETGEIIDLPLTTRELFEQKASACVAYAMNERAQVNAAIEMLKLAQEQIKKRERRLDVFLDYIAESMKAASVESVDCQGLASARLYLGRDVSVQLDDGAVFPPELCGDPKPPPPSKTLIRKALEAGQEVPGARLVRNDRLTIK